MKKRKETLLLHFPFFLFSFFTVHSVRTASSFSISLPPGFSCRFSLKDLSRNCCFLLYNYYFNYLSSYFNFKIEKNRICSLFLIYIQFYFGCFSSFFHLKEKREKDQLFENFVKSTVSKRIHCLIPVLFPKIKDVYRFSFSPENWYICVHIFSLSKGDF